MIDITQGQPLVSVVIIAYNSLSTVVGTLDSIARQSYPNVEIVLSDDASPDNTIDVCRTWMQSHPEQQMQIITAERNTGVAGNLNRGARAAHGAWIKIMAADDMLFDYSIERFMDYTREHQCEVCVSRLSFFGTNEQNMSYKKPIYDRYFRKYSDLDLAGRYRLMLTECVMPMPGFFISRRLFSEIGYIDERYPFGEEWPTYITLLRMGYDIPYFDQELVLYRCEGNSLGSDGNNRLNIRVFNDTVRSFKEYRRPLMLEQGMYLQAWDATIRYFAMKRSYNPKQTLADKLLCKIVKLFNPMKYVRIFKRT